MTHWNTAHRKMLGMSLEEVTAEIKAWSHLPLLKNYNILILDCRLNRSPTLATASIWTNRNALLLLPEHS